MESKTIITELDYVRLSKLVHSIKEKNSPEVRSLELLGNGLKKAKRVDSKKIASDFVTMNSRIEITDIDTNKMMTLTLVYPKDADFKERRISVLAPFGAALIGNRVGETVTFPVPKGIKRIRINKILYQPEANGEYLV
jgi:regulator of nucleoside diphosphate kinase